MGHCLWSSATVPPLVKQCHKAINHPRDHHFYRWYGYHSHSWVEEKYPPILGMKIYSNSMQLPNLSKVAWLKVGPDSVLFPSINRHLESNRQHTVRQYSVSALHPLCPYPFICTMCSSTNTSRRTGNRAHKTHGFKKMAILPVPC